MKTDRSSRFAIQKITTLKGVPSKKTLTHWLRAVVPTNAEITIRIVDEDEARSLNQAFRSKDYVPNVLAFPFDETLDGFLWGDIVICASVVFQEAQDFGVPSSFRFAHLLVHGALHLLGYDHENEEDARLMESEEIRILNQLGFANPYDDQTPIHLA